MRTSFVRALAVLGATAVASVMPAAQTPTFRGGIDLIAVDVQVVDRNGTPVADLASGKFSVSIDGHDRRIVSVDQVKYSSVGIPIAPMPAMAMGPSPRNDWPPTGPVTRTFLLAFDVGSFGMAESRRAAEAARAFVDRLLPNDVVGLYSYPFGPRIVPTADRRAIRSALGTIMGGAKSMMSQFHLTPAEVIDINAEIAGIGQAPNLGRTARPLDSVGGAPTDTLRRVLLRECGSETDSPCAQNIEREVNMLAFYYEN